MSVLGLLGGERRQYLINLGHSAQFESGRSGCNCLFEVSLQSPDAVHLVVMLGPLDVSASEGHHCNRKY